MAKPPDAAAPKPAAPTDRATRLAAALRENLKRRKAQARARDSSAAPDADPKVAREKPMAPRAAAPPARPRH
jgi:hypothetical protein